MEILTIGRDFSVKTEGGAFIITQDEAMGMFEDMFRNALPAEQKPYAQQFMTVGDVYLPFRRIPEMWQVMVRLAEIHEQDSIQLPRLKKGIPWGFLKNLDDLSLLCKISTNLARTAVTFRWGTEEEITIEPTPPQGNTFIWCAGDDYGPSLAFIVHGVYDLVAGQEPGTIWGRLKPKLEALAAERCGVAKVEIVPEW